MNVMPRTTTARTTTKQTIASTRVRGVVEAVGEVERERHHDDQHQDDRC
jgi:hypothetical protein